MVPICSPSIASAMNGIRTSDKRIELKVFLNPRIVEQEPTRCGGRLTEAGGGFGWPFMPPSAKFSGNSFFIFFLFFRIVPVGTHLLPFNVQ